MSVPTSSPRPSLLTWGTYLVLAGLAWVASGAELPGTEQDGAVQRALDLLGSLARPDLSAETLSDGLWLSAQTTAVAVWGTALGAAAGFVLALVTSDRVAQVGQRHRWWPTRLRIEGLRIVLDVLRAIPDFAWALVVLVFVGAGPITGTIAIAISTTGMLGRTYGQLLDATPTGGPTQAAEVTGAPRLVVALWGHVPATAGAMLSYTLLRVECNMRNASVIGIVGAGGLGAALFEELGFGRYDRVATFLLLLLALTALTDAASKGIARSLRRRAWLSRRRLAGVVAIVLLAAAALLWPAGVGAVEELTRLDPSFLQATLDGLLSPTLGTEALTQLLLDTAVPLSIAYLSTIIATLAAVGMLLAVPRHDPMRTAPAWVRLVRTSVLWVIDGLALLARGIPDVVWLLLFAVALRVGPLAALAAVATHSFGVLTRLFVEAVDDVPRSRLDARMLGSPRTTFIWGVWPEVASTLRTHVWLQGESNLRAGLIVGIVGAGGLGDAFHSSITYWRLGDASMQALAMIALTILVDRIARRHTAARGSRRPRGFRPRR